MLTYIGKKQVYAAVDFVCDTASATVKFCKRNILPLVAAGISFAIMKYFVPDSDAIRSENIDLGKKV